MSKKKKTRLQKIKADKRRQNISISIENTSHLRDNNSSILSSSPSFALSPVSYNNLPKNIVEYTFVRQDLVRTTVVTLAIILAEFLLFFFLK
ncbi:MAG: hypothetical protein KatS3mg089_0302 [Patescibacteria group bacterium]|nr:MAG: hypothetical protein KatS3mg089_0302 [Patescibacteria group bacterium]